MIKRILVPVDFSDPSLQALAYAVELGQRFKPEFVVLYALEPVYYPAPDMYGQGYDTGTVYQELERAGREQLSRIAAKLQKRRLTVRALLRVGPASHVIVETAKKFKADLIVMSTHERTGLSHVLMGSVAEKVVRRAACPVLTVRGKAPSRRPSRRRVGGKTRHATHTGRAAAQSQLRSGPRSKPRRYRL